MDYVARCRQGSSLRRFLLPTLATLSAGGEASIETVAVLGPFHYPGILTKDEGPARLVVASDEESS